MTGRSLLIPILDKATGCIDSKTLLRLLETDSVPSSLVMWSDGIQTVWKDLADYQKGKTW